MSATIAPGQLRYVAVVEDGTAYLVWDRVLHAVVRDEDGPVILADAEGAEWWAGKLNQLWTPEEISAWF